MNASYRAQMQEDERVMRQNEHKMATGAAAVPGGVRATNYQAPLERTMSSAFGPADQFDEERSFKSIGLNADSQQYSYPNQGRSTLRE